MKSKATATTTTTTIRKQYVAAEFLARTRIVFFLQTDLEKQSKKIREKQRQAKERSEQELLTNIQQQEKVQFPSGQEVTKEGMLRHGSKTNLIISCVSLAPQADLQLLMHRIREVINVLNDFKNKREPER